MEERKCIETIKALYDDMGIECKHRAEKKVFMGNFTVEKTMSYRLVIGYDKNEIMVLLSLDSFHALPGDMSKLLEFINMINWRIKCGKLAVDPGDGEIRYDCYIGLAGLKELPMELLKEAVMMGCSTMVRYYEGLLTLTVGFSDAETEMENVDKKV